MPVFEPPSILHPVRESDNCIRVPNIAVGKVSIDDRLVPVYSAFFSHVCMLEKTQWSLIQVPTQHVKGAVEDSVAEASDELANLSMQAKDDISVFVDPVTLNVFKGCVWDFYSGDRDDIAFLRVRVDEQDARTAWYDVGTAYACAVEKLKMSVDVGKEPPIESLEQTDILIEEHEVTKQLLEKTEIIDVGTKSKNQECATSKASQSSSETAAEA